MAIKIYKHVHGFSPGIMGEVFKTNRTLPYNLKAKNKFFNRVRKTVNYEAETISFSASKVWALAPEKMFLFGSF